MSLAIARVIVVAGDRRGRTLVDALTRMGIAGVRLVATPEEARRLCATEYVDACLAVLPSNIPDDVPHWTVEADAPGRDAGVPSLLLADVVTRYATKSARNSGYVAVIPADIPPRLLYRWIGALLQKQAQQQARGAAIERGRAAVLPSNALGAPAASIGGKLKLQ
jgi:hypothetical protein